MEVLCRDVFDVDLDCEETLQGTQGDGRELDFLDCSPVVYEVFAVVWSCPVRGGCLDEWEVDLVHVEDCGAWSVHRLDQVTDQFDDLSWWMSCLLWLFPSSDQLSPSKACLAKLSGDQLLGEAR